MSVSLAGAVISNRFMMKTRSGNWVPDELLKADHERDGFGNPGIYNRQWLLSPNKSWPSRLQNTPQPVSAIQLLGSGGFLASFL